MTPGSNGSAFRNSLRSPSCDVQMVLKVKKLCFLVPRDPLNQAPFHAYIKRVAYSVSLATNMEYPDIT